MLKVEVGELLRVKQLACIYPAARNKSAKHEAILVGPGKPVLVLDYAKRSKNWPKRYVSEPGPDILWVYILYNEKRWWVEGRLLARYEFNQ